MLKIFNRLKCIFIGHRNEVIDQTYQKYYRLLTTKYHCKKCGKKEEYVLAGDDPSNLKRKVSIIIPYVRTEKMYQCVQYIEENAGTKDTDYEVLAVADDKLIGCPKMVKKLVAKTKYDLVCFLGDDSLPYKDFLKNAIEEMNTFEDGIGLVGFADGTGRQLPTHWLAHKGLLKHLDGEFFHTGYKHCYCDNELRDRARNIGKYIQSQKAIVLHDHPLLKNTKGELDEHYKRAYSKEATEHDSALYKKRLKNNYGKREK